MLLAVLAALVHPAGERLAPLRPARRGVQWLACYVTSIGLLPKLKILFSFYGIATVLDEVYDARMPPAYTAWVYAAFSWVQVDWVSLSRILVAVLTLSDRWRSPVAFRCRRPSYFHVNARP